MKYILVLSFLLCLPAQAVNDYTYLNCTGKAWLVDRKEKSTESKKEKYANTTYYLTLDEANSRLKIGKEKYQSNWLKANFNGLKISAESRLSHSILDRYTTFKVSRDTGEFKYYTALYVKDWIKTFEMTSGICIKQAPVNF